MALKKFNLDLVSLDNPMVLIHGPYGAGKTHLQGDFLRWAKAQNQGPVGFLNIEGEDGSTSVASMGLGEVGQTAENVDDYDKAIEEYAKSKTFALAVDSLPAFHRLVVKSELKGEYRFPDPAKDGERAKMLWGQISAKTMGRVLNSRKAAKFVLWVAPYDKSEDPVVGGNRIITPDLPGKMALGCAGWFDFVGYLSVSMGSTPDSITRKVTFAPSGGTLTRQRIPSPIIEDIKIPQNKGGWENIYTAMKKEFEKLNQKKG